jgi:hypothetical protein
MFLVLEVKEKEREKILCNGKEIKEKNNKVY